MPPSSNRYRWMAAGGVLFAGSVYAATVSHFAGLRRAEHRAGSRTGARVRSPPATEPPLDFPAEAPRPRHRPAARER